MQNTITIAADDFGLSHGITDTILETVDKGPVTLVSVIPNGEAVEYAIEEYKKRSEHLTLAVHINLTEGRALSAASDITLLANAAGNFKYDIAGLWIAYLTAGSGARLPLREQVRREITTQFNRIREASGLEKIAVNGHQHVHLIPFVFDELIGLPGITKVRTVREPFQWSWSLATLLARIILASLSKRVSRIARLHDIATNDSFVGFVHSGYMTEQVLRTGLAGAKGRVEMLLHPGSALSGELNAWKRSRSDVMWHYSPWRARERNLLLHLQLPENQGG